MNKYIKQGVCTLLGMALFSTTNAAQTSRYIVGFKDNNMAHAEKALANIKESKIQLRLIKDNAFAVNLPKQAAENLAKNPRVAYVEQDQAVELTTQTIPYSIPMIQADQISDANSSGMKICVIDTGVQIAHEDLAGANISGTADPQAGLWYEPENAHGTYMIGGIAAINNNIGVMGAMPNGIVQIHSHKLPLGGKKWASSVANGVDACVDNNANIISLSLTAGSIRALTNALQRAHDSGLLIIASAGNDGDTTSNHPADNPLVMSVSAVDKNKKFAPYSNQNEFNEIAAPGSAVIGTGMMGVSTLATFVSNGVSDYEPIPVPQLDNSQNVTAAINGTVQGLLVDCGIADSTCQNVSANICLIEAVGSNLTSQVLNCQAGGAVGAILTGESVQYDGFVDTGATNIPAATISVDEAVLAASHTGQISSLTVETGNYNRAFGTSLSSPKVAAAAALAWSYHPSCSNEEIRNALNSSAEDLGTPGRDDQFGYGLVQAAAAKAYLDANPCGANNGGFQLSSNVYKSKGKWYLDLTWSGSTASDIDIYKDNVLQTTVANTGNYTERLLSSGTFTYRVCDATTNNCSNQETVTR